MNQKGSETMVSIIIIGSLMFGSMVLLGLVGLAAEQLAEKELQREEAKVWRTATMDAGQRKIS